MKEAIQKAIEGGWKDTRVYVDKRPPEYGWEFVVCDPLFWQALGKQQGWDKQEEWQGLAMTSDKETSAKIEPRMIETPNLWKTQWHRFIDHLAEGKDVESFFQDLFKQNQ